jgi:hypothetical protein
VQFVRLVENQCIEQSSVFKSDQPEFSGIIKITWTFQKTDGGNEVSVKCDDVPVGISQEDHEAGITTSHNKLAMFVE